MLDETKVNEHAARQLRGLRTTTGLSQTKLAREMNMSPQQVQKYEWGINRMSVGRLAQFAEAFDVSVLVFFPSSKHNDLESVPPPTMRFLRLINKIDPAHYDQVYVALKAIAKLADRSAHANG